MHDSVIFLARVRVARAISRSGFGDPHNMVDPRPTLLVDQTTLDGGRVRVRPGSFTPINLPARIYLAPDRLVGALDAWCSKEGEIETDAHAENFYGYLSAVAVWYAGACWDNVTCPCIACDHARERLAVADPSAAAARARGYDPDLKTRVGTWDSFANSSRGVAVHFVLVAMAVASWAVML
jgi:hypothetical protein